jgi:hypothetical protein
LVDSKVDDQQLGLGQQLYQLGLQGQALGGAGLQGQKEVFKPRKQRAAEVTAQRQQAAGENVGAREVVGSGEADEDTLPG